MKNLSQTQFFVAAAVLVFVVAMIAVLAEGLKKYDMVEQEAETMMIKNEAAVPPSSPDAISAELQKEETLSSEELQEEINAETAAVEEELQEVTNVTESYE